MDILITKNEKKLLKKLLELSPIPEVTLSYNELLGYLYGIAITPDLIRPSEWMPVIFGEGMPEYENEDQAQRLIDAILSVLNKHISAFHGGTLLMPFNMENLTEKDIDNIWEWTSGFEEALSLRPQCWEEEQEDLSDEERDHLMYSLIVIEGVVHPDEAADMFDYISKNELEELGVALAESEVEKALQVQIYLLQALALAVETVQNHGAKIEAKRQVQIRASVVPFPVRSSTVGRNDICPCGSTKKYKECCGMKLKEKRGLYDVKSKKDRGKVIQGDFTQHRKKLKESEKTDLAGPNYQLEITLAYTEPPVWRRVQVPSSMTLADFHMVIQYCMGWQDYHMHQFQVGLKIFGPQLADDYAENILLDESRFKLLDIEKDLLQGIVYTYDYGDSWEHVVSLEKVIPESEGEKYPILRDGSRACPPEDIGGVPGYQDLIEALANPEIEEYEELANLPGLSGYDPDLVDIDSINQLLKKVYGNK